MKKVMHIVGLGKQNPQQVAMLQNDEKSFLSNMGTCSGLLTTEYIQKKMKKV